jgi:polyhydroxybutyrate depolymerase
MNPKPRIWIVTLLIPFLLLSCRPMLPDQNTAGGTTYKAKVDLRIRGFRRSYLIHLPEGYDPSRPMPLVVVIHGAFDTAEGMETFSGFSDLADKEAFIVAYPNGFGLLGFLQHWNAGHCCGKAAADDLDDVGFLEAVIEDTCDRLSVDRTRIYMTGFSNGGMMTYRFAAEKGARLAAIAPLAAAAGGRPDENQPQWSSPVPRSPLPVLTIHGLSDSHVPFEGGMSPETKGSRTYWSVEKSLSVWINSNHCAENPTIHDERNGNVLVTRWLDCDHHSDVALYALKGWDHRWPGLFFTADLPSDHPLQGFDAAQIIWNFFKNHHRSTLDR